MVNTNTWAFYQSPASSKRAVTTLYMKKLIVNQKQTSKKKTHGWELFIQITKGIWLSSHSVLQKGNQWSPIFGMEKAMHVMTGSSNS